MAQLSLALSISCSIESRLVYLPGSTFMVLAYQDSPGQNPESRRMVVVLVVVVVVFIFRMHFSFSICMMCECETSNVRIVVES